MELANKFQNAKIYKITDNGYNKCYIGSTCEELSQRMARHRIRYKSFLSGSSKGYIRSFDLFNDYNECSHNNKNVGLSTQNCIRCSYSTSWN